jgi:hypothetical protein
MSTKPEPGRGEPDFTDEKIATRQRNAGDAPEPPPLIIDTPQKRRVLWDDPPTAAEKRGAPASIPRAMWDRIADAMRADAQGEFHSINDALAQIGRNFGFVDSELIERGVIAPPPAPNPTALKGARR